MEMLDSIRPRVFSLSSTLKHGGRSAENRRRLSAVAVQRSTENNLSSCADSISALVDSVASSISVFLDDAKESAEKTVRDLQMYWVELTDKRSTREEARKFYHEKYSNKKNEPKMEYSDNRTFTSVESRFLSTTGRSLPKNSLLKKLESYLYEKQPTHSIETAASSVYANPTSDSLLSMSKDNFSKKSSVCKFSSLNSSSKEEASSSKATVTIKRQLSHNFDVTSAHILEKRQCLDVLSGVLEETEVSERERIQTYNKPKVQNTEDKRNGPEQVNIESVIVDFGGLMPNKVPEDIGTHKDFQHAYKETSRDKLSHKTMYTQAQGNSFSALEKRPGIVKAVLHVTVQYLPVTKRLRLTVDMVSGIREKVDQHKDTKTLIKVNIMLNGRREARKTKKKSGKEIVEFNENIYFNNLSFRDAHLLCLRFRMFRKYRIFPWSRLHFVGEAFVFLDETDIVTKTLSLKLESTK